VAEARAVSQLRVGAVQYFVGNETVHATVTAHDGGQTAFRLCALSDCLWNVRRLLDTVEGPSSPNEREDSLRSFAHEWGRALLPPYSALREFDVLVLIPHYILHFVPLHAVWIEEENAYLGAARAVSYNSSATQFCRSVDRNPARQHDLSRWIPGAADRNPVGAPPVPKLCGGEAVDVIGGLTPAYRDLAKSIASRFQKSYGPEIMRFNIKHPYSEGGVREPTYETLYLISHGYYDPVLPVNSGLLLDNPLGGTISRPIRVPGGKVVHARDLPFRELPTEVTPRSDCHAEMMTIGELQIEGFTDTELVALLGCSTGAGHVLSGDTVESIAYQWLKLGAASVIASLWTLDIRFITRWMPVFLDQWLGCRQPKAVAWQEALAVILNQPDPLPYYDWASVQLLGDWL